MGERHFGTTTKVEEVPLASKWTIYCEK
jgi:hypothetical protein